MTGNRQSLAIGETVVEWSQCEMAIKTLDQKEDADFLLTNDIPLMGGSSYIIDVSGIGLCERTKIGWCRSPSAAMEP